MRSDYERRFLRVTDYIFDNPAGDLSLTRLADVAAMSPHHWHRVFRAMTGETPSDAVRRIRLLRAAMMLVQDDRPVADIAEAVGYPNAASFSRAFAAAYGAAPSYFRRDGRPGPGNPRFHEPTSLTHQVEIVDLPPHRLAALTHRGDYNRIDGAFERLVSLAAARRLMPMVRGAIGVFYDDPAQVAFAELRAHAGFALTPEAAIDPPLEQIDLAPGRHAMMRVVGPYSQLADAYDQLLGGWLPQSGEDPGDGPIFLLYGNMIGQTPPSELITDICLPLK